MRVLLITCCILLSSCQDTWHGGEAPRQYHLKFVNNKGISVLQDSTQSILLYKQNVTIPERLNAYVIDTSYVVSLVLFEEDMNQEFSFSIPSLNYQGKFLMRSTSLFEPTILLFNGKEIMSKSNSSIPNLFVLELPL